jgi:glycosyltransferase involved in cell wall biosynthesis
MVIGDGPLRGELESLAESLGIRVEFLGHRSDAINIVRTLDVFVLASTRESFGLTLIEALSQEVPVVASRTGGVPEIVDGETTGLLAEPGNPEDIAEKVCRLLEDPELAHRLAEEGCKSVRSRFSAEAMLDRTQDLYLEIRSTKPETRNKRQ